MVLWRTILRQHCVHSSYHPAPFGASPIDEFDPADGVNPPNFRSARCAHPRPTCRNPLGPGGARYPHLPPIAIIRPFSSPGCPRAESRPFPNRNPDRSVKESKLCGPQPCAPVNLPMDFTGMRNQPCRIAAAAGEFSLFIMRKARSARRLPTFDSRRLQYLLADRPFPGGRAGHQMPRDRPMGRRLHPASPSSSHRQPYNRRLPPCQGHGSGTTCPPPAKRQKINIYPQSYPHCPARLTHINAPRPRRR